MTKNKIKFSSDPYHLKILIPAILTVLAFLFLTFMLFIPSYERGILASRKLMIKELTESAWSIVNEYYKEYKEGKIDLATAQEQAKDHLRKMRYGKDGKDYFWINDLNSMMVMHPYREDLEGANVSSIKDNNGVQIYKEFVKAAEGSGNGYVNYLWQWEDGSKKLEPKISYVKLFKEWEWIIGTGIYLSDVKHEISDMAAKLVVICVEALIVIVLLLLYNIWQSVSYESERNKAREELESKDAMFRALTEDAMDITTIIGKDGLLKYINPVALKNFGYDRDQVIGAVYTDFLHGDDVAIAKELIEKSAKSGTLPVHFDRLRLKTTAGEYRIIEGSCKCFYENPAVEGIVFIGRDITDKLRSDELAEEYNTRCRQIIENALEGIMIASIATKQIRHVNPAICKMLGYAKDELMDKKIYDIHPKDQLDHVLSEFETQAKGEKSLAKDIPCLKKNGEILYADVTAYPLLINGELCNIGFFTDVTYYKEVDRQLEEYRHHLEELVEQKSKQLVLSEKLSITGRLAASIAHEINNPLQGIFSNMAEIEKCAAEHKEVAPSWGYVRENIERIKEIISQMLDIYRKGDGEKTKTDINALVNNVTSFVSAQAKMSKVSIRKVLGNDVPRILIWKQQVYQVILNLILNAVESSKKNSEVVVSTSADDDNVEIFVKDSGKGISEDNIDKVFEAFFSTKIDHGVGLGLFVCKGLIDNHKGTIEVKSKEGEGTKFTIKLPISIENG